MISEAVIVCTRNRPADLERLLDSLIEQTGMDHRVVLVVDASDIDLASRNEDLVRSTGAVHAEYVHFAERPSLARQRNTGVAHLDENVKIVHFLDDDVTLAPGCLDLIAGAFSDPLVLGAGGRVEVPGATPRAPSRLSRLFLLDSARPGIVRISGAAVSGQVREEDEPFDTEWLGGCASYRRAVLLDERFDPRLDGYSLDEDLDLSFRVGRRGQLRVVPDAIVYHHESTEGRLHPFEYARDRLIHRYWFLEKNVDRPFKKPAFWWSTLGRLLAARFSSQSSGRETYAGLKAGAVIVWRREHPLLMEPL